MQFDTYHVFTVDEHTIEAIRVLNTLERGGLAEIAPVASGLIAQIQSRRALYLAMLLHDIAKGRGGDHSESGRRHRDCGSARSWGCRPKRRKPSPGWCCTTCY